MSVDFKVQQEHIPERCERWECSGFGEVALGLQQDQIFNQIKMLESCKFLAIHNFAAYIVRHTIR